MLYILLEDIYIYIYICIYTLVHMLSNILKQTQLIVWVSIYIYVCVYTHIVQNKPFSIPQATELWLPELPNTCLGFRV